MQGPPATAGCDTARKRGRVPGSQNFTATDKRRALAVLDAIPSYSAIKWDDVGSEYSAAAAAAGRVPRDGRFLAAFYNDMLRQLPAAVGTVYNGSTTEDAHEEDRVADTEVDEAADTCAREAERRTDAVRKTAAERARNMPARRAPTPPSEPRQTVESAPARRVPGDWVSRQAGVAQGNELLGRFVNSLESSAGQDSKLERAIKRNEWLEGRYERLEGRYEHLEERYATLQEKYERLFEEKNGRSGV